MLEIKNLSAKYGKREILHNINLSFEPNKLTVVLGKNGCGKSTLISAINSTLKYDGSITLDGEDISTIPARERAKRLAVLPQMLKTPSFTVKELVTFGRSPYLDLTGRLNDTDIDAVDSALKMTSMTELADKPVSQLSGGERQTAYLAMILAQNTDILLLDEPTTFMDINKESAFLKLLGQITAQKTVIMIMHNINHAVRFADNIVLIDEGSVVFNGSKADCLENKMIEKVFGLRAFNISEDGENLTVFTSN